MAEEKKEKKERTINSIVKSLRKDYTGLTLASELPDPTDLISTGNLALDLALEGGVYFGYASEFSGFSGSGKSLMLQLMLAYAQKKYNALGIWFDRENAWFNSRAEELGIDLTRVIRIPAWQIPTVTDTEIMMRDILDKLKDNDIYKFIVLDSISAYQKSGKIERADMGKKSQEIHNLFRSAIPYLNNKTSFNFSNHRTYKIGVMFGDNTTTTGGEAPKYFTTYRIQLEDRKNIIDVSKNNEIIGNWITAEVLKTRTGPNSRKVSFPFLFKKGIEYYGGLARLLANKNILQPTNKKEFDAFKQSTLKYNEKEEVNEHHIEKFLEKHQEICCDKWPEYVPDKEEEEDNKQEDKKC